jgi:hypothetical protein
MQISASQRAVFADPVLARYNGPCVWTYGIVSPDVEALRHEAETKTTPVVYLLGVTGGECHHIDLGLCAVQGRSVVVGPCRTSSSMLESQSPGGKPLSRKATMATLINIQYTGFVQGGR